MPPTKFQEKLEAARAAKAAQEPQTETADLDLIPEAPIYKGGDSQLDVVLADVDIVQAYQRWCNKSPVPNVRKTEGLKVSCPNPAHPDKDPSAWLNTDKGLWNCGVCEMGGDKYDIAAWRHNHSVPGYKRTTFRRLKEEMAADLGYIKTQSSGTVFYEKNGTHTDTESAADEIESDMSDSSFSNRNLPNNSGSATVGTNPPTEDNHSELSHNIQSDLDESDSLAVVLPLPEQEEPEEVYLFPKLDWRKIVAPNTFLDEWMAATTQDDVPEEYHFWNGLMAVSFALGRDVTLFDRIPVLSNLFICLLGRSGDGKSQSRYHLKELLGKALPYKHNDWTNKGVRNVTTPGSAEVLIYHFSKPIFDPADNRTVVGHAPVRGLVDFNELSALSARTNRQGSALKPVLIEFYDNAKIIGTSSMTHGTKEAHNPFACITTTTQPRAFRELMRQSDIDSGFLNRWLFVGGKEKRRTAIGGVMVDVDALVPALREIWTWAGKGRQLTWELDAAEAFEEFYHKIVLPGKKEDETGLLVRIDLTLKKLALLLTANSKLDAVPLWVVEKLVPLYNYLLGCYGISSAAINNTLHQEIRGKILELAQRYTKKDGRGVSIAEVRRALHRRNYPMEQMIKVLKFMTELGELEKVELVGKVGRPTVRYRSVD
jgi:hypothetical protein